MVKCDISISWSDFIGGGPGDLGRRRRLATLGSELSDGIRAGAGGRMQAHGTDGRRLVVPFATRCRTTMLPAGRRSAAFLGSLSRKPCAKPRYSRRARTLSG